jgi:hypothetical protein
MSSFLNRIDELVRLLGSNASAVNARQGDRVYNFHYRPSEWTAFRQNLHLILKRLKDQGFTPHVVSFADICLDIFNESRMYAALSKREGMGSFSHKNRNESLYSILAGGPAGQPLTARSPIVEALEAEIKKAAALDNGVLILTDMETIHPLFRVSAFEQILQGKFIAPTVMCYPGEKGNIGDNPSFLGFYKSDGNYRSTHIY